MRLLLLAALALASCGDDGESRVPDADLRPDAFVPVPDAGPKLYDRIEDFPTEECEEGSLASVPFLGKWLLTPDDDSQELDVFFLEEEGELTGLLEAIPATRISADDDHLFMFRPVNMVTRGIVLCGAQPDGTVRGYSARCNALECDVVAVTGELVEPVTQ